MGIVQNKSINNTMITFSRFGIGTINARLLETHILEITHYGIVTTILSFAGILMPIFAFGVQNTLIRFFSHYKTQKEKDEFLTFMLFFPLYLMVPVGVLFFIFYQPISNVWIQENPSLKPFFWMIPVVGLFMAYFELFYAWVKVHMQSVIGNFISEVFVRLIVMVLLVLVYFEVISKSTFIYSLVAAYFFQLFAMCFYAFSIKMPVFNFVVPNNLKDLVQYSFFIIISGGVAVMLIDFDKVMIAHYMHVSNNSLYAVAIFISTVIAVPSRAMTQIVAPITAKLMVENKMEELNDLYKKSAINLQIIGGFIMMLIFLNIKELYFFIPDYKSGISVVFMIGLSKFYDVLLGNNNSIIVNTKYYRTVLLFGIFTVILMVILNMIFIPMYGIAGAAFATLLTIIFYNTVKLFYVIVKLNLNPFTIKTVYSFALLIACFLFFYFWDFHFHPIINILLKSGLITVFYLFFNYKLKISQDFNRVVLSILKRLHLT